ncbi:6-phosphogluconolactonase [Pseudomonas aeruginosa]|nr:6-phosphogluconolactonase [Pseudomonas aeruginosa]
MASVALVARDGRSWYGDSELKLPAGVGLQAWSSASEQARGLAASVADHLRSALAEQGQALLVVSGGRSPVAFLEALSEEPLDWSRITVSLADERWVPESHADSNAGLVRRHLLRGEAAKARFIGLYQPAASLEEAAELADHHLHELPLPIDVLVLGMGDDGHTASLFPNSPGLDLAMDPRGTRRCLPMWAPSVPHQRLTLPRAVLAAAKVQLLAIQGQSKLATLNAALAVEDERRDAGSRLPPRAPDDPLVSLSGGAVAMHDLEQKTARIDTLCREARILPVITIDREADILPMADALAAGGLTALEITLRTAHGLTAIRRLSEERPHLRIGAGTVLRPADLRRRGKGRGELRGHPGLHRRVAALRPGQRSPAVARRGQRFRDHARLSPRLSSASSCSPPRSAAARRR